MKMLSEKEGPNAGAQSFSRSLPAYFGGILTVVWLGAVVWTVWSNWGVTTDQVVDLWNGTGLGSAMQWGQTTFFGTVVPVTAKYLGGGVGKAVDAMKGRGGGSE